MHEQPVAIRDENSAHAIAASWRPVLRQVVSAFANGDYQLRQQVAGVAPVTPDVADQIRDYISDYGATLMALPEEAWDTSCAQWMGSYWEVLIDLYTKEEGGSDLVLTGKMEEVKGKMQFTVGLVYVP